jgi:hypothetical protein
VSTLGNSIDTAIIDRVQKNSDTVLEIAFHPQDALCSNFQALSITARLCRTVVLARKSFD